MAEVCLAKPQHHDIYPFISPSSGLKDAAKGRSILITGAGTGIGKSIAETFAKASAETIVIVGRRLNVLETAKSELEAKYSSCSVIPESCDVSDQEAVDRLFEKLKQRNIEIDVLVNNAGVNLARNIVKDTDPEKWWTTFEILLKGPYLMTRAWLRARTKTTPAAVIMTSTIGSYNKPPTLSAYGSSKAALNRLVEWIAAENKDQGVQAAAFHPGGVAGTDLTSTSPEWLQQYYTETAELGAGTCLYLSTERAAWLSGRYVDARWDLEELEKSKERVENEDLLKMSLLGDVRMKM